MTWPKGRVITGSYCVFAGEWFSRGRLSGWHRWRECAAWKTPEASTWCVEFCSSPAPSIISSARSILKLSKSLLPILLQPAPIRPLLMGCFSGWLLCWFSLGSWQEEGIIFNCVSQLAFFCAYTPPNVFKYIQVWWYAVYYCHGEQCSNTLSTAVVD